MKKQEKAKRGNRMQNQIAVIPQSNTITISRNNTPSDHEMMVFHTMAEQAVSSKMYKGIGEKAGVMMIMLSARELGIPPMSALNGGLCIIQGKVEISARMMSALIRKAGHQIQVKECTPTQCVLIGKRSDTGESQNASFSVAEAQQAGIFKAGGGWTKFPKDMCFARALSRLARQLFSDVIGMGYIEGEISQTTEMKNSECEHIISDQAFDTEEVVLENEAEYVEKYLNMFDKEDKHDAMEYLKVVQAHFEWSTIQTVKELLKDEKKLFEKFNTWVKKIKQMEKL